MRRERKLSGSFSSGVLYASNAILYGFTGLYYCFIQLYLHNETPHSSTQIGILLSIAQAVAIFAPLFWGICADKARYKKTALMIIVIGVTVFYCAVPWSDHFLWLCLTMACTMFFLSALGSVLDVICMETASTENLRYGPMRLMGMFGYGFVSFGLSFFIADNLQTVFKVCAVMGLLCCICVGFMPGVKGHAYARKMHFSPLFKGKNLPVLIAILATAQFAYGYYLNFFPSYLTNELSAPTWLWGTNVLITTLSEAPFFLWFDALFSRLGMQKILPWVAAATALRYLLLAIVTKFAGILLIGLLTGFLSVSLLYSVNYYVNRSIAPSLRASAQTLVYALGLGIPRMLSGLIGGMMTEAWGTNVSLAVCAAVAGSGFLIYFLCFARNHNRLTVQHPTDE